MGLAEWQALAEMVEADAKTSPPPRDLPGGIRARRDGDRLLLERIINARR